MKTIPTEYKGYHFRSRTEAKWAVFFDALNMPWVYEPEGFEFADGTKYLPDFYLPSIGMWAEVKGPSGFCEKAFAKAIKMAGEGGEYVLCLSGAPDKVAYRCLAPYLVNGTCVGYDDRTYRFLDSGKSVRAARSARFEFGQSGATL